MVISKTPFRISFFGGGTDYPEWFRQHGGSVLATTINKYCYLTCRYLPPFFEHRIRIVYSRTELCQTVDEIQHPAVRAVLQYLGIERGVEVHYDGDLPARSGIGSSSSFTIGLLHSLYALTGRMADQEQLAADGVYIEREVLHECVGQQDQVMAAHGGLQHVRFSTDGKPAVRPVILPRQRMEELQDHLMLCFTGVSRTASQVAASYVSQLNSRHGELSRMAEMVEEGLKILRHTGDLSGFGDLLDEAWTLKCRLGSQVSTPEIEQIYAQARRAGAIGGKLLGAGGGGFLLLFVPPDRQPSVRKALADKLWVPFRFERHGSQIIYYAPESESGSVNNSAMPVKIAEECCL